MFFSRFNIVVRGDSDEQYVLFNTLSGSVFIVGNDVAQAVESKDIKSLTEEQTEFFANAGILVDDSTDELAMYDYLREREKFSTDWFTATLLLTWECNLRCIYCFQEHTSHVNLTETAAETFIRFVENTVTEQGLKGVSVVLFGGEPFCNIDIGFHTLEVLKLFAEKRKIGFSCSIITNGTLLTHDDADRLAMLNCSYVQITLDGVKEIHDQRRIDRNGNGSYDKTIAVLKMLNHDNRLHTIIRINIDKTNLNDTYTLLHEIGKSGLNLTNCTVDFGIVKSDSDACANYAGNCLAESDIGDVLYALWNAAINEGFHYRISPRRKYLFCGLYREHQYTITPDLSIYKCWEHAGMDNHRMGKIDDDGRLVDKTPAFYRWMTVSPFHNEDCTECAYLPACGGGCAAVSYRNTGSYDSKGCYGTRETINKQLMMYMKRFHARQKAIED